MYSMLYMTTGSEEEAEKIASHLLEKKLIACANLLPIKSIYRWKGNIVKEKEIVVVMKTRSALVEKATEEAKNVHSYEVPCIVSYRMEEGLEEYLRWIDAETRT